MIDSDIDFGDILDAPEEAQPARKLSLKPRVKPWKATLQSKSSAPNPAAKIKDGKTGIVTQENSCEELGSSHGRAFLTSPPSETVDDTTGSQGTLDTPSEEVLTVPSIPLNNCGVVSGSAAGSVSQYDEHLDGSSKSGTHHESSVVSDIHASPDSMCGRTIDDVVDFGETFDTQAKDETISKLKPKVPGKLPKLAAKSRKTNQKVEASNINMVTENERSHTNQIGLKDDRVQAPRCHESSKQTLDSEAFPGAEPKGKGKSVSFVLPDSSEGVVACEDTSSVMDDFSRFCDDLYDLPQKTAAKEHADNVCPYPEEEPSHCAVEQPISIVGEKRSSLNLCSRSNLQKAGISQHTTEDYLDEDFVEASTSVQDNDHSVDYSTGSKRKIKRKSRDSVEEEQQQDDQNGKSQVSSRGRKKKMKDAPTEKTEKKKLSHRIRQKRMEEVKTLLEKPYEGSENQKLSAAQLRLLQEARERIHAKENLPGPSSNPSSQHENPDDFDCNRYDESENFDEDRTDTNRQNVTKLNYHSYMNRKPRSKWSKSETDLFYQGLRQFGSDFAMIQQLFPDKTRHHIRQKFKAEEKKNPMLIHDALIRRSGDNSYYKKVIKQLNIEDVIPDFSGARKQDGASSEGGPAVENASDDLNEENSSDRLDKEHDMNLSDAQEEEHAPGNSDDDLSAIFDWY